jgi:hypothetical protein
MLTMHRTRVVAQEAVDRLEDIVKSCDKAFTKMYTHLSKIVATDKLDLSRSGRVDPGADLRAKLAESAETKTVFSNAEKDSKMRQLNKFMLQVTHWAPPLQLNPAPTAATATKSTLPDVGFCESSWVRNMDQSHSRRAWAN